MHNDVNIDKNIKSLNRNQNKKQAHFILMGKGGIGKTLTSSLLAQYLMAQGGKVQCIDTDPINATLSQINGLSVREEPIKKTDNGEVDYISLADLFNDLFRNPACYVFDSGASSYQPMYDFLITMQGLQSLCENNYPTYLHTIVATGPEMLQTMEETAATIDSVRGHVPTILWINERNGHFHTQMQSSLTESQFYQDLGKYISGVIVIPHMNVFDRHLFEMLLLKKKLFSEVLHKDAGFFIMQKSRLQWLQKTLFSNIEHGLKAASL